MMDYINFEYFRDALCMSLMSSVSISQERSPVDGATSSQSSTSSASSPLFLTVGSFLSPLFSDLVALITARKNNFEYYTVVILTDGQFTDSARYIRVNSYIYKLNFYIRMD